MDYGSENYCLKQSIGNNNSQVGCKFNYDLFFLNLGKSITSYCLFSVFHLLLYAQNHSSKYSL